MRRLVSGAWLVFALVCELRIAWLIFDFDNGPGMLAVEAAAFVVLLYVLVRLTPAFLKGEWPG